MDRRKVLAIVAVALLTSGCGGDKKTSTKPRASPTASPAATTGETGATGQTGAAPAPKGRPPNAPAPAPGAPLQQGSLQPTAPGNYSYAESGQATLSCPPNPPQNQPPPNPSSLRVEGPNGNRQRSVRDRRHGNGQGELTTNDFEFRGDGIYLAYIHQTQTSPLGSDTTEFEPNPPVLVLPRNPTAGQSWQFTLVSKDGRFRVDVANTIEAPNEPVTLGNGSAAGAVRLKSNRHVTGQSNLGAIDITENATSWVSLEHRLILKEISDASGKIGISCTTSSHIEELLQAANPS